MGSVEGRARSSVGDGVHDLLAARVVNRPPAVVAQPQWPRAAPGVGLQRIRIARLWVGGGQGVVWGGLCEVFKRAFRFGDDGGTVD